MIPIIVPMRVTASEQTVPMSVSTNSEDISLRIGAEVGYTGPKGDTGVGIESAVLNPDYTLTLNYTDGTSFTSTSIRGAQGAQGEQGPSGEDGISPSVRIIEGEGKRTIAITDRQGTHTTTVLDGETGPRGPEGPEGPSGQPGRDGEDGQDGQDGADGFSPVATVSKAGKVATITITDKNGTTTAQVSDGEDGQGAVTSVNGQTGVVVLDAEDVGALPDDTVIPTVPTDVSAFNNDAGYLTSYTETDPTVPSWAKEETKPTYTASEVGALPDDTAIPSKTSDLINDSGYITGMTILSYGSSTWNDFKTAYDAKKVVYCRASSNSNPASGSQTRLAFMAYVNNAESPTEVEFQYYRSVSSHSATQQGDQVYVYKLTSGGTWSVTTRECYTRVVAGTGLKATWSNGILTISLDS